jgi:hypothetical protein
MWWKLITKKHEFEIKRDKTTRRIEAAKVKNAVRYRA